MDTHESGHDFGRRPLASVAELEAQALSFAEFQDRSDPEGILRKGFIEEIVEIALADLNDKDELAKEVGDTIWYLMAIAHQHNHSLAHIVGNDLSLDEAFASMQAKDDQLPIIQPDTGVTFRREDDLQSALAFDAWRLIDTINPRSPEVWIGVDADRQTDVVASLGAAYRATGQYAHQQDLSLNDALEKTLHKLASRPRKSHVIEAPDRTAVDSLRARLSAPLGELASRSLKRLALSEEDWLSDEERELLPQYGPAG